MLIQNCYLLSYVKYGDHDAVLHCFSEKAGYQSFFAKGLYTARNRKKPYLFPLNQLLISVPEKFADKPISRLSKIENAPDSAGYRNVAASSILFFVADFLNQVLREEGQNQQLFAEMGKLRTETDSGNIDAYLAFIFRFLSISGVAPLSSEGAFLDVESGRFEPVRAHAVFDEKISALWKRYAQEANLYKIRLRRDERHAFLDTLMIYCQFHITGFRIPQSLAVVREIFD